MYDPLGRYPTMMSAHDLADFLGCSYDTALRQIQTMPFVDIGSGSKNQMRRVLKDHVRQKYGLEKPSNDLRIVKGRH